MQEKAMVLQNEAGKQKCKNNCMKHTKCGRQFFKAFCTF